jgi:hypothetical protein
VYFCIYIAIDAKRNPNESGHKNELKATISSIVETLKKLRITPKSIMTLLYSDNQKFGVYRRNTCNESSSHASVSFFSVAGLGVPAQLDFAFAVRFAPAPQVPHFICSRFQKRHQYRTMVSSFLVDSHDGLGFGGVDMSCSLFLSSTWRAHKEPNVVELTDDSTDLQGNADILSVSDDGSLEDVEVEERDMMLPSIDVGDSATDPISLPPMTIKTQKYGTRRVSMDSRHQCAPTHQVPIYSSAASPSFAAGNSPQMLLPVQPTGPIKDARELCFPLTTTTDDLECLQVDTAPNNSYDGLSDEVTGQGRAQEFFSSLRHFADTMKRSEYSRREVILGRRRLRHMYRELAGTDHLLSGESWGRSVEYQLARRDLVAEIYGQLLRRYSSHPADSDVEACYTAGR